VLCDSGMVLTAILTFLPAAALLVVAPGPDSLLVLRNAARGGRRAGLATAAGTVTGLLVWAAAAALGLAALVRASEVAYLAVRWAGAAYLVFLGSQLIWRSRRSRAGGERASGLPAVVHRRRLAEYLTGTGTNLLNPKVGVFFISFLPVFIPRGAPVGPAAVILGAIFLAEGIVWLAAIVLLGERLSAVVSRASVRRRLERMTGLVMIGFGVRLALGRR
jgi:threonine/homoserine/homoserine lactone efflux protein